MEKPFGMNFLDFLRCMSKVACPKSRLDVFARFGTSFQSTRRERK
jgi:hypothetical protein